MEISVLVGRSRKKLALIFSRITEVGRKRIETVGASIIIFFSVGDLSSRLSFQDQSSIFSVVRQVPIGAIIRVAR